MTIPAIHQSNVTDFLVQSPVLLLFAICSALIGLALPAGAAENSDDSPHWDRSACGTCHSNPSPTGSTDLKLDKHSELCSDCHGGLRSSACSHPTNLSVNSLSDFQLPEVYESALADDLIVCTSCHAMELQCTGSSREQYQNPAFLRNGPFRFAGEACFECHDDARYEKRNPHEQVSAGQTKMHTCLLCHSTPPDEPGDVGYRLRGNLQCTGCHPVDPHPQSVAPGSRASSWAHLLVPTPEMMNRMQAAEDRTGVRLPLDPDSGAVYCATCHNPHDPDLQQYPLTSARGAAVRLRMQNICEACHDK